MSYIAQARRAAFAILALSLAAGLPAPATANDSSAELAAGGIVLVPNPSVRLVREDLEISQDLVKVSYVFRNTSRQPVETLVAFPMPDITPDLRERDVAFQTDAFPNFVDFKTVVDGSPIATDVELKALTPKDADVTEALRLAGLPLRPDDPELDELILALKPQDLAPLLSAGALVRQEGSTPMPNWRLQTTFYWRQVFPVGRNVRIEHAYQPVIGAFLVAASERPAFDRETRAKYCIGPAWEAAARRVAAASRSPDAPRDEPTILVAHTIGYILKTARNWRGGRQPGAIGDFRLVLDKGEAANIMTLCSPGGLTKISPTQFELRRRDFTPNQDLEILILQAR